MLVVTVLFGSLEKERLLVVRAHPSYCHKVLQSILSQDLGPTQARFHYAVLHEDPHQLLEAWQVLDFQSFKMLSALLEMIEDIRWSFELLEEGVNSDSM